MPNTPQSKKSEFLSVRVSKEVKKELEDIADSQDRSVSWLVGKIIEKYLKGSRKL